jgi:hypothetical protein
LKARGLNNTMRDLIPGVPEGVLCIALARVIQLVRTSRRRIASAKQNRSRLLYESNALRANS